MKLKHGMRVHDVVHRSDSTFEVDGGPVQVAVSRSAPSRFECETGSGRATLFLVRSGDLVFAQVGGRSYTLKVVPRVSPNTADSGDLGALEAPMPGRVTRVNVALGEAVKRSQELIVVEAMKMENAIIAPEDGKVTSLVVKVGDMVAPGSALIVLETS